MEDTKIADLEERWRTAEVAGDHDSLAGLVAEGFRLVGPLGFVLDRSQWLARYDDGGLVTSALDWRDVEVRFYGDAAISVGVHDQRASYRGHPADGAFRSTHVWVGGPEEWRLASVQLSPISAHTPPR